MADCAYCGGFMAGRPGRRYCGDACRTGAYRARQREARAEVEKELRPAAPATDVLGRLEAALAEAIAEPRLVGRIAAEANSGNWRASAWLLERAYPERWAPVRARDADVHHEGVPGRRDPAVLAA